MQNSWVNLFRVLILIIAGLVLAMTVLFYNFCVQQKSELNTLKERQMIEAKVNSNQFKYQQNKIEHLSSALEEDREQIRTQNDAMADQKDAFLQEVEKRQQVENDNKSIQTSLIDIKAEADAIKQDMKGWQKDYVAVLAELAKKMDDSHEEIKSLGNNLDSLNIPELKENINSLKAELENMAHPTDNDLSNASTAPDNQIENAQVNSQ